MTQANAYLFDEEIVEMKLELKDLESIYFAPGNSQFVLCLFGNYFIEIRGNPRMIFKIISEAYAFAYFA